MKKETIEKANELLKQIEKIKTILEEFQKPLKDVGYERITLKPFKSGVYNDRSVNPDMCPISAMDIAVLYEARLKVELERLERELEDLKD